MEKCYDYFGCEKIECIMFQNKDDHPCWDTSGTLCFFTHLTPIVEINSVDEAKKCNFCLYKNTYYKNNNVKNTQFY